MFTKRASMACVAALAAAMGLSGCMRSATFANRTTGPVVVSVAMLDPDGDQTEVVGMIVDAGKEMEVSYQPQGAVRASVWKGEVQLGAPAAVIDLAKNGVRLDVREEGGGVVVEEKGRS